MNKTTNATEKPNEAQESAQNSQKKDKNATDAYQRSREPEGPARALAFALPAKRPEPLA